MALLNEFRAEVREQLRKALEQYGITEVDYRDVEITCNIRGKCAGRAGYKSTFGRRKYYLKFNAEAIEKHNDEMVKDTIPHEIAHTVCQIRPELGKNHDRGWKRVCRSLGGDDSRTHDMVLTPAKVHNKHEYLVSGRLITVGPKQHNKIQRGHRYTVKRCGSVILPSHWQGIKGQPKAVQFAKPVVSKPPKSTSSTSTGGSKKQQAQAIFNANPTASRGQIIEMFMTQLNMTKAGASTYHYNCKNAA